MKPMSPINAARRKSALCSEGGFSLMPLEGSIPLKGTMQAALKAAEGLPDTPDADFDDLEESLLHRQ